MDMAFQNIFSYCVGALALLTTFTSIVFYCRLYLPTSQLRSLDELFLETNDIYRKANEESLLLPEASREAQKRLTIYEGEIDEIKELTYRAMSCTDTLRILLRGQTRRIMHLAKKVKKLRSFLMTASQQEKARRMRRAEELRHSRTQASPESPSVTSDHTSCILDIQSGSEHPPSASPSRDGDQLVVPGRDQQQVPSCSRHPTHFLSPHEGNLCILNSTCSSLPILGWWTRKACQSEPSLPSYIVHREFECPSGTITAISTRSSTQVADEPTPACSSVCPPSVGTRFKNISLDVPGWGILERPSDSAHDLNPDHTSCLTNDSAPVALSV